MATKTWRQRAAPIIAETLQRTQGLPEPEVRKALYDAYPFGLREYYPYKTWLNEIRRQRGIKGKPKILRADYVQLDLNI